MKKELPHGRSSVSYLDAEGRLSRTDGPARVTYRRSGDLDTEEWFFKGAEHRVGGPAYRVFGSEGHPMKDIFYVHGSITRIDGPAIVDYFFDGEVESERYFLAGEEVELLYDLRKSREENLAAQAEELEKKIRSLPIDDLAAAMEGSERYAPLVAEGFDPVVIADAVAAGVRTPEGVREMIAGAPVEWVLAFEEGREPEV